MKKVLSMIILFVMAGTMLAQGPKGQMGKPGTAKSRVAQRKYQILVENERDVKKVEDTNNRLMALQEASRGDAERGLLGELLFKSFSSAFKQKTVNATSNLLSLGVSYLTEALKSDREQWYRRAQQQCYYHQPLSAETKIDDFYALPSNKGAMDPENLKFEGFGCKNYIEVIDGNKEGVGVFYIFCKMRRDSIGLAHIVNHSKFLVEIDSLVVNPKYCNLPNDSTGSADSRFSFEKRDNLNLTLKVRFYSSWMNQATMITNDQQLGEFIVNVNVDKRKLNSEGLFIYDKNDPDLDRLVSIDGDCYIVPRSYTGTNDGRNYQPTWGTGQYRVEMEVSERCTIVDSYYQIREAGNGRAIAFADATPGKVRWDKAKWQVEWKAMNARKKGTPFLKNAWQCIVSAYKGTGWVATLTDPLATALYSWETQKLDDWLNDMHDKILGPSPTPSAAMTTQAKATGAITSTPAVPSLPTTTPAGATGVQGGKSGGGAQGGMPNAGTQNGAPAAGSQGGTPNGMPQGK